MVSIPRPGEDWRVGPRYEVRKEVGHGSYGHVCEALDTQQNTMVAIKRYERIFRDTIDAKRILREIAILSQLKSKHVAQLLEVIAVEDAENFEEIYAVLELAESDLKKVIRSNLVLRQEHIEVILYGSLCALQYIHSAGILHRDIKPGNILINSDCSIKICDFGLARDLEVEEKRRESSDLQGSGKKQKLTKHIATRWYRAPEVILLLNDYSAPVDIWSLGCVFGELLGKLPGSQKTGALFPGKTCFPMSPRRVQTNGLPGEVLESEDQLNLILNVVGSPNYSDTGFITDPCTFAYVHNFPPRPGVLFCEWYPQASSEALDLLSKMLVFSPEDRISVREALNHPLFHRIRDVGKEEIARKRVVLEFDSDAELKREEVREQLLREISRYHSPPKPPTRQSTEIRTLEDLLRRTPASARLFSPAGERAE